LTDSWAGTGEHGVGIGKRDFLVEELGAGTVALMKAIKRTVDPLGLLNPGKVSALHTLSHSLIGCKLYPDDKDTDFQHH
jgi:hypothetical protein